MAASPERKISVVVPVYNERENIAACLRGLWAALKDVSHEILVCYDFEEDTTLVGIREMTDVPSSSRRWAISPIRRRRSSRWPT
jgi:glycosyltransferase involved in cell wall biosynthesis